MKRFILFFYLLPLCLFGQTTLLVPSQYSTIQSAINASSNDDTVLVSPGTYYENINFNGKNIVLASEYLISSDTSYITSTIIDGNQNGTVVTFSNNESSLAVLTGFTLTNGAPNVDGGGIYIDYASPSISHLIIEGNASSGMYIVGDCTSDIHNLIIRNIWWPKLLSWLTLQRP